ncbi:MAG: hypothetical protein AAGD22_06150 [Verrucomicrobiota bacterium]
MKRLLTWIAPFAVAAAFADKVQAFTPTAYVEVEANITGDVRWTCDNVYILTRIIFIEPGGKLTIEPGTLIRGIPTDLSDLLNEPGALAVTRGGVCVANGKPEAPIILTSIDDPNVPRGTVANNYLIPTSFTNSQDNVKTNQGEFPDYSDGFGTLPFRNYAPGGPTLNNAFTHTGVWGGLIVLGKAYIGVNTDGLTDNTGDDLADLDQTDNAAWTDADTNPSGSAYDPTLHTKAGTPRPSSNNVGSGNGSLNLVSPLGIAGDGTGLEMIEGLNSAAIPGGPVFGQYGGVDDDDCSGWYRFVQVRYGGFTIGQGNEINSITTGGVGRETVFQWNESSFNQDDGFEPFGGTYDPSFQFAHYIGDDSFDGDQGHRSCIQFIHALQHDSSETNGFNDGQSVGVTDGGDLIFELDGAEPSDAIPNTLMDHYCGTGLINDDTSGGIDLSQNGIFGFFNFWVCGDAERDPNQGLIVNGGGSPQSIVNNFHFTDPDGIGYTTSASGTVFAADCPMGGTLRYSPGGYDPRPANDAPPRVNDGPVPPSSKCFQRFAGFQRNNTMLKGWSHIDILGVVAADGGNAPRVVPSAVLGTATTQLTWQTDASRVSENDETKPIYWVLCSTNQCDWFPIATVSDNESVNGTTTDAADEDSNAGVIVYDTGLQPVTGQVRYYTVICN